MAELWVPRGRNLLQSPELGKIERLQPKTENRKLKTAS
jgi:hypothetical protein